MISVFVDMECLTANISRAAVENQEQDWSMHHFAPSALSNPMIHLFPENKKPRQKPWFLLLAKVI